MAEAVITDIETMDTDPYSPKQSLSSSDTTSAGNVKECGGKLDADQASHADRVHATGDLIRKSPDLRNPILRPQRFLSR